MVDLGDLANKGKDMVGDAVNKGKEVAGDVAGNVGDVVGKGTDAVKGAIQSDKVEEVSDSVLDKVAGFAKKIAPDQFDGTIDNMRDTIDRSVGSNKDDDDQN